MQKLPEGDRPYEVKSDGYRALDFKDGKNVRLVSRNQKGFNYPRLLDALKLLPAERVILDGEIAALDEQGRSSLQLLQLDFGEPDFDLTPARRSKWACNEYALWGDEPANHRPSWSYGRSSYHK